MIKSKSKVDHRVVLFILVTLYFVKYHVLGTAYYLRPSAIVPLHNGDLKHENVVKFSSYQDQNGTLFFISQLSNDLSSTLTQTYRVKDASMHKDHLVCAMNSDCHSLMADEIGQNFVNQGRVLSQEIIRLDDNVFIAFLVQRKKDLRFILRDIFNNEETININLYKIGNIHPRVSFIKSFVIEGDDQFIVGFSLRFGTWEIKRLKKDGTLVKSSDHIPQKASKEEPNYWKERAINEFRNRDKVVYSDWSIYHDSLLQLMPFRFHRDSISIHFLNIAQDGRIKKINVHEYLSRTSKTANSVAVIEDDFISIYDLQTLKLLTSILLDLPTASSVYPVHDDNGKGFFYEFIAFDSTIGPKALFSLTKSVHGIEHHRIGNFTHDNLEESEFGHTVNCYLYSQSLAEENNYQRAKTGSGKRLFAQDLCKTHKLWQQTRFGRREWLEDTAKIPPPLIEIMGEKGRDLIVYSLTSDGSLNAHNRYAKELFRVESQVSWLQVSRSIKESTRDTLLTEKYSLFRPSMESLKVIVFNIHAEFLSHLNSQKEIIARSVDSTSKQVEDVLVLVGWDSVSIVDKESGNFLASHSLPSFPTGKAHVIEIEASAQIFIPCRENLIAMIIGKKTTFSVYKFFTWILAAILIWFIRKIDINEAISTRLEEVKTKESAYNRINEDFCEDWNQEESWDTEISDENLN